jgi:NitT/TauT family transport system substrate-binding protein
MTPPMFHHRRNRAVAAAAIAVLALTSLAACGSSSKKSTAKATIGAPETTNISVTWSAGSGATSPLWLAADEGIFAKHGLNVQVIQSSSTAGATAVIAGSAQFFYGEATSAFQAVAQGQPVEIVATFRNKNVFKFLVLPSIKTAADLKGKSLAISSVGDSTDLSTRTALTSLKVSPNDVTLLATGTSSLRLAAMVSGKVAGTLLTEPTATTAIKAGMKLLLDQTKQPFVGSGVSTSKDFAKSNPNTVDAFMESMIEGVKFLDDPANKQTVLNVMAKYLVAKPTDASVLQEYDTYAPAGALARDPFPDGPGADALIGALKSEDPTRFGKLDVKQVYDTVFAQKLRDSGFLTATWGSALTSVAPVASPSPTSS